MGEYFKEKKLGTCEHLMYVTRKEIENRVQQHPMEKNTDSGSLKYLKDYLNLDFNFLYRYEFEDELNKKWDEDRDPFKTIVFEVDSKKVEVPHRDFKQVTLDNGECYNVPFCFYSDKAKELGIKKVSSPDKIKIAIVGERYTKNNPQGYTVFKCACCNEMFSLSEDEVPFVENVLRLEGYAFESTKIKARYKRKKISKEEFITKVVKDGTPEMISDVLWGCKPKSSADDKELLYDKLNSLNTDELNKFSRKHLCNYEII